MSAKRGHVRGSVEPITAGIVGYSGLALGGILGVPLEFTFTVSNPSAANGKHWYFVSDNGAAFVRQATSTGNPLASQVSIPVGPNNVAGHKMLGYVEAHDNSGELLGRSAIASVQF
jgi:hypothetical protein